ncbi:MAG: hypothetical protein Tsb0034_26580 [Ekhidna sp.]
MLNDRKKLFLVILCVSFITIGCTRFTEEEQASIYRGEEIYITHCVSCHGPNGDGLDGAYPSLQKPQIESFHTERAVSLILNGSGFDGGMKPIALEDQEIVDVVNYIQNEWGNEASILTSLKEIN